VELLLHVRDLREGAFERALRVRPERRMVDLDPLERAPPVVDRPVERDEVEALLQQRDGRQEALALQAVGVEVVRPVVRGHAVHHAAVHGPLQQPSQDHRVGDVVDVELVEADEPVALRDPPGDRVERVLAPLQALHLAVDVAHEVVEMDAALAHQWNRQIEAVHQEALAAPHRAPEVGAARQGRADDDPPERAAAPGLVVGPLLVGALQPLHGGVLRLVGDEAAPREHLLVVLQDRQREPLRRLRVLRRVEHAVPERGQRLLVFGGSAVLHRSRRSPAQVYCKAGRRRPATGGAPLTC
jgi:hypothetical protein